MPSLKHIPRPPPGDPPEAPRSPTLAGWPPLVRRADSARPESLSEQVYRRLLNLILAGDLPVNSRLPAEQKLAEAFDVSRPIVRQALDRLRREGLTESRRGSGTYVIRLAETAAPDGAAALAGIGEYLAELEFRVVIEAEAAFLASQRRGADDLDRMARALDGFAQALDGGSDTRPHDQQFHQAIARATGNVQFGRALDMLGQRSPDVSRLLYYGRQFQPLERGLAVLQEHRDILDLIRQQDAEAARRTMKNHLERARIRTLGAASG